MTSEAMEATSHLDRQSPIPLHYQLKEMMRSWITGGRFDNGGKFPPERELLERFSVSRMTIRRALSELVNEGLLIREQGRGSFVVLSQVHEELGQLTSFTEYMRLRGVSTSSKILHSHLMTDEDVAGKMRVPKDEEFVRIQRIRSVSGNPIALQTAFVRHRFCSGLLEDGLIEGSLYRTLEDRYALHLSRAVQTIEAKTADEYEKELLGIPLGRPALWLEQLTYLANGQPIEFVRSTYRGDQYRFTIELLRHHSHGGGGAQQPDMIGVRPNYEKLRRRATRAVVSTTGKSIQEAQDALAEANFEPDTALIMLMGDLSPGKAQALLRHHNGKVDKALKALIQTGGRS